MKKSVLATLAIAAILGGSTGFAAARISGEGIYLDPASSARFIELMHDQLRDIGIDPETSAFKVRATQVILTSCIPRHNNMCFNQVQSTHLQCPTSILVQQPDGTWAPVAVVCNPNVPDAEGNCDCQVRNQQNSQ